MNWFPFWLETKIVVIAINLIVHCNICCFTCVCSVNTDLPSLNDYWQKPHANIVNLYGNEVTPVQKVTSFGRAAFQPPIDINFPRSFGYIRKLTFRSPRGNLFHSHLFAPNIRHPGLSKLHRHRPLRVPTRTLIERSLGNSFLVPREIHVRPV